MTHENVLAFIGRAHASAGHSPLSKHMQFPKITGSLYGVGPISGTDLEGGSPPNMERWSFLRASIHSEKLPPCGRGSYFLQCELVVERPSQKSFQSGSLLLTRQCQPHAWKGADTRAKMRRRGDKTETRILVNREHKQRYGRERV